MDWEGGPYHQIIEQHETVAAFISTWQDTWQSHIKFVKPVIVYEEDDHCSNKMELISSVCWLYWESGKTLFCYFFGNSLHALSLWYHEENTKDPNNYYFGNLHHSAFHGSSVLKLNFGQLTLSVERHGIDVNHFQ